MYEEFLLPKEKESCLEIVLKLILLELKCNINLRMTVESLEKLNEDKIIESDGIRNEKKFGHFIKMAKLMCPRHFTNELTFLFVKKIEKENRSVLWS